MIENSGVTWMKGHVVTNLVVVLHLLYCRAVDAEVVDEEHRRVEPSLDTIVNVECLLEVLPSADTHAVTAGKRRKADEEQEKERYFFFSTDHPNLPIDSPRA